jgi:glutamate formiminotransferase/glutamate formiminotransferase/formiminotetrahydrofolate cyclodeaminase
MTLIEQRFAEVLAAVGAPTPAPASGSVIALTGALAAALAQLAAGIARDDVATARAHELSLRLAQLADEDAAAYAAFLAERTDESRAEIVRVPLAIAASADEVAGLADGIASRLTTAVAADARASAELARAASRVARRLAEVNA